MEGALSWSQLLDRYNPIRTGKSAYDPGFDLGLQSTQWHHPWWPRGLVESAIFYVWDATHFMEPFPANSGF